jgi:2'-5' RNA ligase
MKRRRIFLAINLPEQIKSKLVQRQQEFANLPLRLIKKTNLHITLLFIGYVDNEELLSICQFTREVAKKHEPFEVRMERICPGPPGRRPRMIWVECEKSEALTKLKNDLGEENHSVFHPHITLARNLRTRPDINQKINLSFWVDSIEVMESHLARGGSDYAILESIKLGE